MKFWFRSYGSGQMASVNILPGLTICGWIQYHLTSASSFPPNAGSVLQLIRLKQHGLLSSPNTLRFWQYVKHFQNYTRLNKTAAYLETTNLKEYLASNFSLALGLRILIVLKMQTIIHGGYFSLGSSLRKRTYTRLQRQN